MISLPMLGLIMAVAGASASAAWVIQSAIYENRAAEQVEGSITRIFNNLNLVSNNPRCAGPVYQLLMTPPEVQENPRLKGKVLIRQAQLQATFGEVDAAQETLSEAKAAFREADDRRGEAETQFALSKVHESQGRDEDARAAHDAASEIYRDIGPRSLEAPFDVARHFVPSGWMGDGINDREYVQFDSLVQHCGRPGDEDGLCTRIDYTPGPERWAGIHWQYPEHNWADVPGTTIRNAQRIVFWVRGATGNEIVQFEVGGIVDANKAFGDSFIYSLGRYKLTTEWRRIEKAIPNGTDLSNVVGAFSWVASADNNPGTISFYIDGIRYE